MLKLLEVGLVRPTAVVPSVQSGRRENQAGVTRECGFQRLLVLSEDDGVVASIFDA